MSWNVRYSARALPAIAMGAIFITASAETFAQAAETAPANAAQEAGQGTGRGKGRGGGKEGGRGTGGGSGGGAATQEKAAGGTPLALETIKGEIIEVDGSTPASDGKAAPKNKQGSGRSGPMISVRTEKETLQVHAGAPHFRHEQNLDLKLGDVIEVSGVRGMKTPSMFIAHSITRGSQVVRLRDAQGTKLWKPRKRTQEPELVQITGRIVALDAPAPHAPGSGLGRATQFVFVRAGQEDLAVEAGPEEYRESQGLTLKVEDEVTVSGWRLPSAQTAGKPILLAANITKGKTMAKLRDDRRKPLWRNKK